MDLIYATAERVDIGVLHDYEFDLAYGADENDFELTIALNSHCCEDDYIVYMIDPDNRYEVGTEYGGIIDSIEVDTNAQTVTYSGRTWHGVLSEKVIEPEEEQDFRTVDGNANDVLTELLEDLDLTDLFAVTTEPTEIEIESYQFPRYVDAYSGICDMLAEFGGKLKLVYDSLQRKVVISAEWLVDYSMDGEWDSSQVTFRINKRINPVNHLVCLGQGDLRDRAVIHLFTDENGGIQPYTLVDDPVEDADYILDKSQQLLFGKAEIYEVYDFPSSEITNNYVRLDTQPSNWRRHYAEYYLLQNDGSFKSVEAVETESLTLLTSKPSDWERHYSRYCTADGKAVEGVQTETYIKLTKKPKDWNKNYSSYYTHVWDGVQYNYNPVNANTVYTYKHQTRKPSDWESNYHNYYQHKVITETVKDKNGKAVKGKDGKTLKRTYIGKGFETVKAVRKGDREVTPTWKKTKYFTRYSNRVAPSYTKVQRDAGSPIYRVDRDTEAPTWASNTYYDKQIIASAPPFKRKVFYRLAVDRYAELIKDGIKKLNEINASGDSIDIDLNLMGEYDVGDIVGAREETTGIEVWQPITKKIVNITRSSKTINYRIGDITL